MIVTVLLMVVIAYLVINAAGAFYELISNGKQILNSVKQAIDWRREARGAKKVNRSLGHVIGYAYAFVTLFLLYTFAWIPMQVISR